MPVGTKGDAEHRKERESGSDGAGAGPGFVNGGSPAF